MCGIVHDFGLQPGPGIARPDELGFRIGVGIHPGQGHGNAVRLPRVLDAHVVAGTGSRKMVNSAVVVSAPPRAVPPSSCRV